MRTSRNGKQTDDEYYTQKEDVEKIMKQFNFKNKWIYLPCDSAESEFVKYCNYNNLLFMHTSDDYHNHDEEFKNCDVIITNPPFSKWSEFFRYVNKYNKKWIIICSVLSLDNKDLIPLWKDEKIKILERIKNFIRPDGSKKSVGACVITNIMKENKEWID